MKEFKNLNKSEIKKAVKLANKLNGRDDCVVTGWFWDGNISELNFVTIKCEICQDWGEERADYDVEIEVYLDDRRMSWAHSVIEQTHELIK